jgi:hypothetical protein
MKFEFKVCWRWRTKDKIGYNHEERIMIFLCEGFDGYGLYASPISTTIVLPLIAIMIDGTVLPWLPYRLPKLFRRN